MKNLFFTFLAGFLVVGNISCARLNNVISIESLDSSMHMASYSDDIQNTFIKKSPKRIMTCSQPAPDAIQSFSDGITLGYGKMAESANNSVSAGSLGGRNPEVLIVRELMFRACEFSMNFDTNYDQARDVYREFLGAATTMSQNQTGTGTAATAGGIQTSSTVSTSTDSAEESQNSDSDSSDDTDDSNGSDDSTSE